jgi:curli biogenesis system outer membrane secretion channel CsgG
LKVFVFVSGTEFRISSSIKEMDFDAASIRAFQLLHKSVMGAVGFAVLPLHIMAGQCVVFCMYSVVKYWNVEESTSIGMLLVGGTDVLVFWLGVLETSGRFYNLSRSSIEKWKKEGKMKGSTFTGKYIGKFCKSCKPLGIGLEGVYVVKRLSVLKFARRVVTGTITALITLEK